MPNYDESTYGEEIAEVYDDLTAGNSTPADQAVEFLASVAGKRRVLELGIGTGRVAIPLAARGFNVSGIDASPKIVEQMRRKPGGEAIPVEIGNFADVKVGGKFSLIYVIFNTLFMLSSQEEQIRCFTRVARHLTDDGVFAIEAFFPDQTYFDRGQRVAASIVEPGRVKIDSSIHDRANQTTRNAHVLITEAGIRIYPIMMRYAFPSELDLMARVAGMRLRERFGGWNRAPFTAASNLHVSLYELDRPAAVPVTRPKARKNARPMRNRPRGT